MRDFSRKNEMNKDLKTKISLSVISFLFGIFLCLEGSGITQLGEDKTNAPGIIIVLSGVIFILVSIMLHMGKRKKINNLLASLLIAIMGIISGWVSLFSKQSGFSGNHTWLNHVTSLPVDRILFGFGSLICFVISFIAFRMFLKSAPTDKTF